MIDTDLEGQHEGLDRQTDGTDCGRVVNLSRDIPYRTVCDIVLVFSLFRRPRTLDVPHTGAPFPKQGEKRRVVALVTAKGEGIGCVHAASSSKPRPDHRRSERVAAC